MSMMSHAGMAHGSNPFHDYATIVMTVIPISVVIGAYLLVYFNYVKKKKED